MCRVLGLCACWIVDVGGFGYANRAFLRRWCHRPVGMTMVVVVRALLSITARFAWAVSVAVGAVCGLEIGRDRSSIPIVYGPWSPVYFAVLCGGIALVTPGVAIAISARSLSMIATIGAVCFWLLLILFNVNTIVAVLLAHLPLTHGFVWLSLVVLMFELVSGYLPAFVCLTRATQRPEAVGARATVQAPHIIAPLTPSPRPAPRTPSSFHDLIRFCQRHGCARFPSVTLEADGSLFAGQRAYALALGLSTGAGHARLWKEHREGRITVTPGQRGTRIALCGPEGAPGTRDAREGVRATLTPTTGHPSQHRVTLTPTP